MARAQGGATFGIDRLVFMLHAHTVRVAVHTPWGYSVACHSHVPRHFPDPKPTPYYRSPNNYQYCSLGLLWVANYNYTIKVPQTLF